MILASVIAENLTTLFPNHFNAQIHGGMDLKTTRHAQHIKDIDALLKTMLAGSPILKVKVFQDNLTTYSTEHSQIGEIKSSPGFLITLNQRIPISKISFRGEFNAFEGVISERNIVETYIPAGTLETMTGKTSRLTLEMYTDVTSLVTEIDQSKFRLIFGLLLLFAALYGALIVIVRRADRIIDRQYENLSQEIIEHRRTEAALLEAKEHAEIANRAKSAFLSSMSHELRTPMNAVMGFAQLLEGNPKEPLSEDQTRCVRHIIGKGGDLVALIDKILLFADVKDGAVVIVPERVAIGPTIRECLDVIRGDADSRGIELIDAVAEADIPEIHIDPGLFKDVLLALLSNAIAYNRDAGDVTVSAEVRPEGWVRIAIADTGLGIALDKQDELFQPFHRLGIVHSNVSGSGVGLSVAKELTNLMGGRIGFESEVGRGSTFWIEFPAVG